MKGERRGGRAKGTLNKQNADIKEMVVQALSEAGGVKYLVQCAHKQPVAFLGLVGRVLPLQIQGKGENGSIPISFEWAPAHAQLEGSITPQIEAKITETEEQPSAPHPVKSNT